MTCCCSILCLWCFARPPLGNGYLVLPCFPHFRPRAVTQHWLCTNAMNELLVDLTHTQVIHFQICIMIPDTWKILSSVYPTCLWLSLIGNYFVDQSLERRVAFRISQPYLKVASLAKGSPPVSRLRKAMFAISLY